MKKALHLTAFITALMFAGLACGLSSNAVSEAVDTVGTAAAQTIEAEFATQAAQLLDESSATETPTEEGGEDSGGDDGGEDNAEATATDTAAATATATDDTPCNQATFISDVTVPDGTDFEPGESFTKTWRLQNIGSCTWTPDYSLVFDSGDQMGAPGAQQLIPSGGVVPGANVDISVNLTAPNSPGSYQGFFRIRDSNNVVFGLSNGNAFWVKIDVVAPTSTPTATYTPTPTATSFILIPLPIPIPFPFLAVLTPINDGSVRSDGTVLSPPNVGDTNSNVDSDAFIRFDISSIPGTATIIKVDVDFSDYDTLGDPFGSLQCLRAYDGNFFPLGSGDYDNHSGGASARWCSTGDLDTVTTNELLKVDLQANVGSSYFELTLDFNNVDTDNDGVADMVRFGTDIKLNVSYTTP